MLCLRCVGGLFSRQPSLSKLGPAKRPRVNLRINPIALIAMIGIAVVFEVLELPQWMIYATFLSSAIGMGTQVNFESLAKKYINSGHLATTSSSIMGASGVKHNFAFAVTRDDGVVQVVADTALSVTEVEEVKVLGFFAKVFDVKPKSAILCVSPRLSPGAAELARQYGLFVIEHERPRELIPLLAKTIDKIVGTN